LATVPEVYLTPQRAVPGDVVSVLGLGFPPGAKVNITASFGDEGGVGCWDCIGHASADARGVVRARFVASAQLMRGAGGPCALLYVGLGTEGALPVGNASLLLPMSRTYPDRFGPQGFTRMPRVRAILDRYAIPGSALGGLVRFRISQGFEEE
jgi:hypothetical protein